MREAFRGINDPTNPGGSFSWHDATIHQEPTQLEKLRDEELYALHRMLNEGWHIFEASEGGGWVAIPPSQLCHSIHGSGSEWLGLDGKIDP